MTSLPASDPGSAAVWGSKRINSRPQSCLCLTWSGYLFKRRRRRRRDAFPKQTQNLQLKYQPVQMSSTKTNKILINRTPIQNKSGFSNPSYVSVSDILPVPKALPRKRFAQLKNKKSIVLSLTPEK